MESNTALALAASMSHGMDLGEKTKADDDKTNFTELEDFLGFRFPPLKPSEMFGTFMDQEMVQRKGMILIYQNLNSFGATSVYGATRTGVVDPRRIPNYLEKYKSVIRTCAVERLQVFFKDTHVSCGVNEVGLTADDYSISFSFASLTPEGRALNVSGRNELPIDFATFAEWVAPQSPNVGEPPVYVVNVFVQLQESNKRSGAVLKRHREEEAYKADPSKRPRPNGYNGNTYGNRMNDVQSIVSAAVTPLQDELASLKRMAPVVNFPQMKETAAPVWRTNGRTSLPE